MVPQPTFTWTVSGGGTISSSGLFTAASTPGGPYTVRAANGSVSGTASVTVMLTTSITVISPNGGEVIPSGSPFTILYDAPSGVSSVKVRYSLDNGVTWLGAVGTLTAPGSFDWSVPTPVKNTTKALVRVISQNASNVKLGSDKSDRPFTIEVVSITAPVAAEIVTKGSVYPVTWTTNGTKGPVSNAKVFYTFGSSGIWNVAKGTVVDPLGSFSWDVPSPAKAKIVKLKVVLKDARGVIVGNAVSKPFIVQ
jgi:hypothetical protein